MVNEFLSGPNAILIEEKSLTFSTTTEIANFIALIVEGGKAEVRSSDKFVLGSLNDWFLNRDMRISNLWYLNHRYNNEETIKAILTIVSYRFICPVYIDGQEVNIRYAGR